MIPLPTLGLQVPLPQPRPPAPRTIQQAPPPQGPPEPFAFGEACIAKAAVASAAGSVFGAGLGFLLGSYTSISPPIMLPGVPDPPEIPLKYILRESWMATARKARRWGRNMLVVGGLLSGTECCVEKFRAKHDLYNNMIGGAITGAVLAARQGPWGIFFGASGFAAFGMVTEYFMGNH